MHTVALPRIELLAKDRKPTIGSDLPADVSIVVAVVCSLGGAEVEVEEVGLKCVELVDDVEVESFDGFAGHGGVEGIDEVLNKE